jgi:hypothetical protein
MPGGTIPLAVWAPSSAPRNPGRFEAVTASMSVALRRLPIAVLIGVLSLVLGAASPVRACAQMAAATMPCCEGNAHRSDAPCPGTDHEAPVRTPLCCTVTAVPTARTADAETAAPLLALALRPVLLALVALPAPAPPQPRPASDASPGDPPDRTVLFGRFLI